MRKKSAVDEAVARFPLQAIEKVVFFKRDEITTDLICCEISGNGSSCLLHEDLNGWSELLDHLQRLSGFRRDWLEHVALPPFAAGEFVAFQRG